MEKGNVKFASYTKYERPRRLSESTRALCRKYLGGEVGRSILKNPYIDCTDEGWEQKTEVEKYDFAVREVAAKCPVRIAAEELLVGSASLGGAIRYMVPFAYKGKTELYGENHCTPGFDRVLKIGLNGVAREVDAARGGTEKSERYRASLKNALECFRVWHGRYLRELETRAKAAEGALRVRYLDIAARLRRVPFEPPESFRDGVQALWMLFAFTRLMGNWPGIGRIDEMLGGLLRQDLARGDIDLDTAREWLAHFFIKGCEWVNGEVTYGGDAQHYQNLILAGIDENGREVANEVTYLVLEVVEELPISDYPVAVRLNGNTPERLLRKIAEAQRFGSGTVSVYAEDVVIRALTDFGYPLEEARRFTNDGCWEVLIPGRTAFTYIPFDALLLLQRDVLRLGGSERVDYPDFESLYAAYVAALGAYLTGFTAKYAGCFFSEEQSACFDLFLEDCVRDLKPYHAGGPKYTVVSPHLGGFGDVANSLRAIEKFVYTEKRLALPEFVALLRKDYEGEEELRREILSRLEYYGNDIFEADRMAVRVFDDYTRLVRECCAAEGVKMPAGISTFGRQIEWSCDRYASPHGYKRGAVLANNVGPTPGTDARGTTALVRSYCKLDLTRLPCGAALDVKLLSGNLEGENGVLALMGLLRGFVALGGFYMQVDVADNEILRQAKEHPENYPDLAVRISGWSARFVTLDEAWQDMIIERT